MVDPSEFAEDYAHLRRCLDLLFKESGELYEKGRRIKTNIEIWEKISAFHTAIIEARSAVMDAEDKPEWEE